jgi:hypothetical protein
MSELNARIGRTIAGPFAGVSAPSGDTPLGNALADAGQREGRDAGLRWAKAVGRLRQGARAVPAAWVLLAAMLSHLARASACRTRGNAVVARRNRSARLR